MREDDLRLVDLPRFGRVEGLFMKGVAERLADYARLDENDRSSGLKKLDGKAGYLFMKGVERGLIGYVGLSEEVFTIGFRDREGYGRFEYGIPLGLAQHNGRQELVCVLCGTCDGLDGVFSVDLGNVLTFGSIFANAERYD